MNKNETNATARIVGPIPFFGNDGKYLAGLTFKTAAGQVLYAADGADWIAAANDVTTNPGTYYYPFSQAETNKISTIAVRLIRPATSGSSTSVAANTLTNSAATMIANQYAGQTLIDSAGTRWPIASNTATAFTLTGSGSPAAGAYTVEALDPVDYSEKIARSTDAAATTFGGQSGGTFSRTQFTLATSDSPSTIDDFYNGAIVQVTDDTTLATNIGAFAVVGDYSGVTKTLTFAGTGLPITPSSNTRLSLVKGANAVSADFMRELFDGAGKLESTWTPGDLIRLIASIVAGKVGDFRSGTLKFRDLLDTKDRWTVVTDPSGRISVIPGVLS